MATWRGITINEHGDGWLFPTWDDDTDISVRHVPGGNGSIVQNAGQLAPVLSLSVWVTATQLASLRTARGESGALSFSGGSATAVLKKITSTQKAAGNDVFYATLEFVRLG